MGGSHPYIGWCLAKRNWCLFVCFKNLVLLTQDPLPARRMPAAGSVSAQSCGPDWQMQGDWDEGVISSLFRLGL